MKKKIEPYDMDINTLGYYIDRSLYAMIKRQNLMLKETNSDLQHAEFIVLKVLNALGGATQSQLASAMGRERSGISRTLASLEKKGYVNREPLNGSTNFVSLSEKGQAYVPMLYEISNRLTEQAFKGFSKKNRETMLRNLDKIFHNSLMDDN